MDYRIEFMTDNQANSIAKWTYPAEYSIYSMDGSEECIKELLNGSYYSVFDSNNELIGYYCYGYSAIVPSGLEYNVYSDKEFIDIGVGLRPDLCGNGIGKNFVICCLEFAKREFGKTKYRLTVASFNQRAISVYEKVGFRKCSNFKRNLNNNCIDFIIMKKSI